MTMDSFQDAHLTRDTLLIFLDETGDEQYSDPKHPVFGIGGCAIISNDYVRRIQKPWNRLKSTVLGLKDQPFHAVDFEYSRPTMQKITAINAFMAKEFYRIAVTTDINTKRPEGYDGHETVSTVVFEYIRRLITRHSARRCMIFFERSERGDRFLERNLPINNMEAINVFSEPVDVSGYLLPKKSSEAGIEIADLIIHTAGKQQRKFGKGYADGIRNFTPDFKAVFHALDRSWMLYNSIAAMEHYDEKQVQVDRWAEV